MLATLLKVLGCIAGAEGSLRVVDIQRRTGLALSTVHRSLQNLRAEGLVIQESRAGRYRLGMEATELASLILRGSSRNHWNELLREVNTTTSYSTLLGRFQVDSFTYAEHIPATSAISVRGRVGENGPLHCTAIGKSLLGSLPAAQCESLMESIDFKAFTETTITNEEDFRTEIERVRSQGFSTSYGEHETNVSAIAVPLVIDLPDAKEFYALSIAGHISEFEQIMSHKELLLRNANRMAASFSN